MNGSQYERKLCRLLDAKGYHIMRAPSSGAATDRELPDVLYSKVDEPTVAGELKATATKIAYYDDDEVAALRSFATAFGAKPRLIARYKGDTSYYVYRIDDARKTDGGNYAVDLALDEHSTIKP